MKQDKAKNMKTITILLTRYKDFFGRVLCDIGGDSYSLFGTLLCFLHIPHKFHDKYFCSQFVAELLEKAGAVELRKEVSLYLPSQLLYGWQSIFAKEKIVFNAI